jgi:hypothetical protein
MRPVEVVTLAAPEGAAWVEKICAGAGCWAQAVSVPKASVKAAVWRVHREAAGRCACAVISRNP